MYIILLTSAAQASLYKLYNCFNDIKLITPVTVILRTYNIHYTGICLNIHST